MIPVLLPNAFEMPELPLFLSNVTWVDFRKADTDSMERLVWGITGRRPESPQQAAEKKVEATQRSKKTKLDLSQMRITALPESLCQLRHLKTLDVSDNQITELPEWLGQLTQLQELFLGLNQLTSVPESLGRLPKLQTLDLSDNQLIGLPESLPRLTTLRKTVRSRQRGTGNAARSVGTQTFRDSSV